MTASYRWFKYLIPLVFTEVYLALTLLIFFYGPIAYHIKNPLQFLGYLGLVHMMTILGYVLGVAYYLKLNSHIHFTAHFSSCKFKFLIALTFIGFLIGFKNMTMSDSFIPTNIFNDIQEILSGGHGQYAAKVQKIDQYSGSKIINVLYFFIAFSKFIIIPAMIFYWDRLTNFEKISSFLVSIITIFSGLATGTNKPIFDFIIIFGFSLLFFYIHDFYKNKKIKIKKRGFFLVLSVLGFLASIYFFYMNISSREANILYIEGTSKLGDIEIQGPYRAIQKGSLLDFTYVWLSNYIVQGYYGLSLALDQPFSWTYGFGGSQFLARQFEWVTGVDILSHTYQHKITQYWGENTQWHSVYSHLANDLTFFGVGVWFFIFFFFLSQVWTSFVDAGNLYAFYLMPLFMMFIIFIPANNQVFGFIETFSAFIIISGLWFRRKLTGTSHV